MNSKWNVVSFKWISFLILTLNSRKGVVLNEEFYNLSVLQMDGLKLSRNVNSSFNFQLLLIILLQDIYVGAVVNFRSHQFVITDADEYALSYAEKHQVIIFSI